MKPFTDVVSALSRAAGVLAMLLLGGAVLVVAQMVFLRYFLNGSTVWQTEFVTYSLVASTFLGCPYVLLLKGHVNVDVFQTAGGPRLQFMLELLARLLSLVFCAILAGSGWHYFHEAWSQGWTTDTIWALPLWIPLLPLPVGVGLLALQYVAELLEMRWPSP